MLEWNPEGKRGVKNKLKERVYKEVSVKHKQLTVAFHPRYKHTQQTVIVDKINKTKSSQGSDIVNCILKETVV